jgi:nicotinamide phosphoribosyltransferase
VLTVIVPNLKDQILAREGKLVIRPDSGDPVKIIVGDPDAVPGSPAHKGVVELLWDVFGGTETDKGYKILDSHVGAIYGDSITTERLDQILYGLKQKGFASANMVFGIGSFTYQYTTRDTYGFAMKSTWVQIDGVGREIFKNPITDDGLKKSAKGRIAVLDVGLKGRPFYAAVDQQDSENPLDQLKTVWEDGKFIKRYTLDEVRATLRKFL